MQMASDKEFRCTLPSSHLNITGRGVVLPCCNFDWKASDYHSTPKDTEHNNKAVMTFGERAKPKSWHWIQDAGLKPILHSKEWQEIRKKSAKNVAESGCHRCYFSEKSGGGSRRTWANETFPTADSETKLLGMELKLGAKCNLECRSCSGGVSNKLLREDSYLISKQKNNWVSGTIDKTWIKNMQSLSAWVHDDKIWDEIKKASPDLEYIQFTGGEPLIINEQYKYLEWLADNNIDPSIQYITNGTIGTDEYKETLWDNFSDLTVDFSLDATEELGEYIRTGSVWKEQVANIDSFVDYMTRRCDNPKNKQFISVAITVSIMNVHNLKPIMDFIHSIRQKVKSIDSDRFLPTGLSINIVNNPDWMDCANLKGEAKEYALAKVQELVDDEKYHGHHRNRLGTVIDAINCEPTSELKFTDMVSVKDTAHNEINSHRDISFKRVAPDWWELLLRSGM